MYIKILDVWIRGKISMINLFIFLWYMNVYIYIYVFINLVLNIFNNVNIKFKKGKL